MCMLDAFCMRDIAWQNLLLRTHYSEQLTNTNQVFLLQDFLFYIGLKSYHFLNSISYQNSIAGATQSSRRNIFLKLATISIILTGTYTYLKDQSSETFESVNFHSILEFKIFTWLQITLHNLIYYILGQKLRI